MIKQPFTDKSKYMLIYLIACPVSSFFIAFLFTTRKSDEVTTEIASFFFFMVYILLVIFGIYSLVIAEKALTKPGISIGARKLILKRHASNISIFLIANLYVFVFSCYDVFNIPLDQLEHQWWKVLLKILFYF
jgi:hypothetical protein